jgi:hypothetical protein
MKTTSPLEQSVREMLKSCTNKNKFERKCIKYNMHRQGTEYQDEGMQRAGPLNPSSSLLLFLYKVLNCRRQSSILSMSSVKRKIQVYLEKLGWFQIIKGNGKRRNYSS